MDNLILLAIWIVGAIAGGAIIYLKQGKYLTEDQPIAFLIFGPLTLIIAIFFPRSMFTSRSKAEGKRDE